MSKYTDAVANPPDFSPGTKFGRLTVLSVRPALNGRGLGRGRFICDCGQTCEKRICYVVAGCISSCGCLQKEAASAMGKRFCDENRTVTKTHGRSRTAEYQAWRAMKIRCTVPSTPNFHCYGGRGITVCERWNTSFENFFADMGEKPTEDHSLHRVDNDGNYEPSNCVWAIPKIQSRHTRTNRLLTFQGQTKTVAEWSEITGIRAGTISERLRHGWSVDQALGRRVKFRSPNGSPIWHIQRAS